jgi:hypothetical protein
MSLATLTEYREDEAGTRLYVNPSEVAAVREWKYHSFCSPITEIVLQSGVKLHVWQDIETTHKRLAEAREQ